jgi:hypothetical protein
VEASLPLDAVDRVLRFGDGSLCVDLFTYARALTSVNDGERVAVHATGVEAVHELLDNAQQSLFLTELFDTVPSPSSFPFLFPSFSLYLSLYLIFFPHLSLSGLFLFSVFPSSLILSLAP